MKFALLLALLPVSALAAREDTSISGISAGAFMAVQMQVAYSDKIGGVGSVAGGPYWCAERGNSLIPCLLQPASLDVAELVKHAREEARDGNIAPLENLAHSKAYLFHSKTDSVVKPDSSRKLEEFLSAFVRPSGIKMEWMESGAHAFPTKDFGKSCETSGVPYVVNCGRDLAGDMLRHFYGNLRPPVEARKENLREFSQKEFSSAGLSETGWAYIPSRCQGSSSCRTHMALHGCQMGPEFIGDEFRWSAGYNGWAEANDIVVIYPNVAKSSKNPHGCWDWFAYTTEDYANRKGPQMEALMKIFTNYAVKAPSEFKRRWR
jgi:hypothetical protein